MEVMLPRRWADSTGARRQNITDANQETGHKGTPNKDKIPCEQNAKLSLTCRKTQTMDALLTRVC